MSRLQPTTAPGHMQIVLCALALVVLGVPLVWADGSGEIAPFPITGAYQATHREDRGSIAIIDFVGNYDRRFATGESNVEARAVVAREFLRTHPDTYDFLVIFSTFEFATGEALALHWGVQNKVQGLGIAQYDVAHLFGSAGRLLACIDMAALSRYVTDPLQPAFETVLATLGHEVLHQWSGRVRFVDAQGHLSEALLGRDKSHWSDLLDTNASVLYGHKWRDNHDGTFRSEATRKFFSPLDLYLAGVYSKEEVPPFLLIDNPQHDATALPQPNITVPGTARTITIDEVMAAEGPRIPAVEDAPKAFRFAWVLLAGDGEAVEESQLAAIEEISKKFAERFAVWTGGRALAQVAPEALLTVTTGTPETVRGGQERVTPAALDTALQDGFAWLRSQQRGDGSWMDKPATQLRDATVALGVLSRLDPSFTGHALALAWLAAQTPESTDYRARQAQAWLTADPNATGLLEPLVALHNAAGGWGITAGYASDPLDTALVLAAMAQRSGVEPRVIDEALHYLLDNHNADGGWGTLVGGPSRISVTTQVLLALQAFKRQQPVQAAAFAWLASQQQPDGGFGEHASTVHDTALALQTGIALGLVTQIRAAEAAAYLLARQHTDGSWEGSAYATAVAVNALKSFYFPNWHVESTVSVDRDQPVDGDRVTLTITVRNNGQSPTAVGVVRLFDGEPAHGGRQIGGDVLVPVLGSGASVTIRLPWDTFGAAGEHTLIALVDPENAQLEVSEQDNRAAQTITVAAAPAGVDLAVDVFTVTPARPDTLPTTLGLSAVVRNAGTTKAEQVRVQLREGESNRVLDEVTLTIAGRSSVAAHFTYAFNKPGASTFLLVIDPDNAIVETTKANNTAAITVETTPSVDVQVSASDIAVAPQPALQGADLTFTVTLRNTGTSISPVTTVQYLLTDGNRTLDLGRQAVQIEAGSTVQRTLPWRATLGGALTFTVQVDPAHLVPERDEQNNTASFHFSVGEANGPNLAVSFQDMTFTPDPGLEGKLLTLTALVRNTGTVEARDVAVAFYNGDPAHGGSQITRQTLALVPAEAATVVSAVWPRLPGAEAKVIFVSVDPEHTITEFSETDNIAFRALEVLSLPDLAIDSAAVRLTPGFPTHGATVQVEAQLTNLGMQAASDVVVRAFAGDPTTGGVQIGTDQRVSIPGGGVAVALFTWTLSGAEEVQTLVIVVDPDNALDEASRLNNVAHKRLAVQENDAFVSQPYFSPNGDGVKDSTTFFFRLAEATAVEVVAVEKDGAIVRHFQQSGVTQGRDGSVEWDGLDDRGRVVRDGSYRLQVRSPAGQSVGEAVVVVDNNRSSLAEAAGTPFGLLTNLTCELGDISHFAVTDDEATIFFTLFDSAAFASSVYRMTGIGTDITPLVQLPQNESVRSLQIAPDGSVVAYLWQMFFHPQEKLFVIQGDGTNLREMVLADQPQEILAVLTATQEVLLTVQERAGNFRKKLVAIPLSGGTPRLLTSTANDVEALAFHGLSPQRDQLLFSVGTVTGTSYYLLDIVTAAKRLLTSSDPGLLTYDVKWAPDGRQVAIKHVSEDQGGTRHFSIDIVHTQSALRKSVDLPFGGDPQGCILILSGNMVWSPESDAVAFDLVREGFDECGTGDIFEGGLYVVDVNTGVQHKVLEFDASFRGYVDDNDLLVWPPQTQTLFYGFPNHELHAIVLDEKQRDIRILAHDNPGDALLETLTLSPTGRQIFYQDTREANNPQSVCYGQGFIDFWSYKSLLNLTADLRATPAPQGGGILLQGTASDLHFEAYMLEYASATAPQSWQRLLPAAGEMVLNDVFATWVPPGPGTYLVRLTATDLAGNQRQQSVRVTWAEATSISDLYRAPALFSPNGDGALEEATIHYRVLEPVHLAFEITNAAGERVRTIRRDHTTIGEEHTLVWDGRDDNGLLLPDGPYRLQVQNFTFPITLDTTPPAVTLSLVDPYQAVEVTVGDHTFAKVHVAPALTWSIAEPHYRQAVIEKAPIDRPNAWQLFLTPDPEQTGDRKFGSRGVGLDQVDKTLFRLVVEDTAGNRTIARVGPVASQLILDGFGDHTINDMAQSCFLDLDQGGLESCVQTRGGFYHPLAPVAYAPLDASDGAPDSVIEVTAQRVRFSVAESIGEPLTQVIVQYRPVSEPQWQEMPLTQFLDQATFPHAFSQPLERRMEAVWEPPTLASNVTYVARLQALDGAHKSYVSNALRFVVNNAIVFEGLIQMASHDDGQQYALPHTFSPGKTGLWGLNVSREGLREVRLVLSSPDDPRYRVAQQVDHLSYPGKVLIFAAPLASCKAYDAQVIGTTLSGVPVQSVTLTFKLPCLNMIVQVEPPTAPVCNGPSAQPVHVRFAPASLDGSTLKVLTLAQTDADGYADIVFNENRPRAVALPWVNTTAPQVFVYDPSTLGRSPGEPDYLYTLGYDTSTLAEGRLAFTARLVNIADEAIALPIELIVDHTPPTLALLSPMDGARVCGIPTVGHDGRRRNVVTLEGSAADVNGMHYIVQAAGAVLHDSRTLNSFAVARGEESGAFQPPHPAFHLKSIDGPLAQMVDTHGQVTAQLEVFDVGGFRQCVQRTFFVDARVDVDPPTLGRELLSPNGDGIADDVTVTYHTSEQVTLDITIYTAQEDMDGDEQVGSEVLRHLETGKTLFGGHDFSTWNGRDDAGTVVPDGRYGLVFLFTDTCGNQRRYERFVEIDTTPPQVVISYPQPQDPLTMLVEIQGSVHDPHLSAYRVQAGGGLAPETWTTLSSGGGNAAHAVLARWNTSGLSGPYVLRLVAQDSVGNTATVVVPLTVMVRTHLISALSVTPPLFSPNGDGRRDQASVSIGVEEDVFLTLTIRDAGGTVQRTLAANRVASRGVVFLAWDGTNEAGLVLPDGLYTASLRAVLVQNAAVTQQEEVTLSVDATPPSVDITRPAQGVVTALGQVQGSIMDAHLSAYTVSLTETPMGLQTLPLSSGASNAVAANLGSLQGLQEGRYTLTVEARDAGDNSVMKHLAFVVDNTPPVVELTAPAPGSVMGRKQSPVLIKGTITEANLARYQLNVGAGADPGTWLTLASSPRQPATDGLGTWDIAALTDGLYTLQVLAEDQAGLHADKRLQLTIDNTPPTVTLIAPAEGIYVTAPLLITGTATDAHLVTYRLEIASVSASTQWSPIGAGAAAVQNGELLQWLGLPPDGGYLLRLTAVDKAGNTAETVRRITVDTTPPGPPEGLRATIVNRQVSLVWQASPTTDLAGYAVSRDGQRLTPALLATAEYVDPSSSEGRYVYTVTAMDQAGLASAPSAAVTLTVDFTPPQVKILGPTSGATVSGIVDIHGTAYSKDDFKVYRVSSGAGASPAGWQVLRQSPVPVQADVLSQWNTLGLSEGARYSLKLEAEDIHGNVSVDQISVTIDNQAPAPPADLTATVIDAEVELTWNANSEPDLLGYLVYRNGRLVQVHASGSDLRLSAIRTPAYTDQAVVDGTHMYSVAAIDQAGNVSAPSVPVTVEMDGRAPHAMMVQPKDGTVFDGTLYLLATVADNDVARVQFQYKAATSPTWLTLGSADTTAPYEAIFNPAALNLPFGTYTLRAVATDAASQVDPAPTALTVTYTDRTRPQRVQGLTAQVDGDTVHVQWTANANSDLAGYHVERQRDNAAPVRLTTAPLTSTSYVDRGLADAAYRYTVIAVDTHSNAAEPSAAAAATVYTPLLQAPHTPTTATTVTLAGHGSTTATVTGEVVTASGSSVLAPVSTEASGSFRLPDLPLAPGDNHFILRVTDAWGNRSKPATVTVASAQAPGQPTGLAASVLSTTVHLTWHANAEADVIGYRLWRNGMPVFADRDVTEQASVSGLMLTWLEPRQVTQVQVQWASAAQRSSDFDLEAWSGQQWVVLAQIRGNQQIHNTITLPQAYRTTQLRLVLQQPAGPVAPGMAAFGGLYTPLITGTAHDDPVVDGRYTYSLTAVNAYGFESIHSASVAVAVGDVVAPEPATLTATVSNSTVSLQWTPSPASDVQRYEMSRNGTVIAQLTAPGTLAYVDTGLVNGTYAYTVTAVDRVGNMSAPSNRVDVMVAVALPAAPFNLTVLSVAAGSALDLHWSPAPGAQAPRFRVFRGTSAGGPYTGMTDTTTATLTDAGLRNGTTYYYVVVALDAVGNISPASPEAHGTPRDLTAPDPPMLYFPTVPGRVFLSGTPDLAIIGTAEPGAQVELLQHGQSDDTTRAQDTLETLEITLPGGWPPVLSPDGRYVALFAQGLPGQSGPTLQLYDSETGTRRDVTAVSDPTSLRWSPDSATLLFREFDPFMYAFFIRQYALADNRLIDLTDPAATDIAAAVVSPDGARLGVSGAVQGQYGLWLLEVATGNFTALVSAVDSTDIDGTSLQWAPDGTSLAYTQQQVYRLVNIATGAIRSLDQAASVYPARWSPDGQALLYASTHPPEQIRRYELRTGTVHDVVVGLAPQWSADGKALLYIDRASTAVISRDLTTGTETTFVQDAALVPASLQVVPSGFVGILSRATATTFTYRRVAPAGRFVFAHVNIERGDHSFAVRAIDAAGNTSAASDSIHIAYQGVSQADLELTADAVLVLPAVPRAGEPAHVSVTVRNRGALASPATTVSLAALHPTGEATLLFDAAALPALPAGASHALTAAWMVPGEAGRYTLVAVADPDHTVVEQSKTNNIALKDLLVPGAALPTVTVHTDAPLYHAQQVVIVTGGLTNGGDAWTGQVVIAVTDTAGFLVQTLHDEVLTGLAYGENREFMATWQTGATFAGAYQVVIRLVDPQGIVIATATAPFNIAAGATVTSSVTSDRRTYTANDQVQVTGTVTYTAGNEVLSGVAIRLQLRNAGDEVVATRTTVLGDMVPGASAPVGLDWNTGTAAVGTYQLRLDVLQTDQSLSQARSQMSIVPSGLRISGSLTLAEESPAPGMLQTATYTVANQGNSPLLQLPLIVSLVDPALGSTLQEHRVPTDVAVAGQVTGTVDFATATLALHSYTVLLQTAIDDGHGGAERRTLATQTFVVTDRSAPVVVLQVPSGNGFLSSRGTVSILARDDFSQVARTEFRLDGGAWQPGIVSDATASLYGAALPQVAEGSHTIQVRATDTYGNVGISPVVTFTVDTTPPQIVVTGVVDGNIYPEAVTPVIVITDANLEATTTVLNGLSFASATVVADDGPYQLVVTASDKAGNQAEVTINFVIMKTAPNQAPVAEAGPDQSMLFGHAVSLNGSNSHDPDNGPAPLSFTWRFASKPAHSALTEASITGAATAMASFTPDRRGDFTLELAVSDGAISAADTVVIHVRNNPSVAHAGQDRNVQTSTLVMLDGGNSFDPDGDIITYDWSIEWSPAARPATSALRNADISGRATPTPRFTPDVDGVYLFQLIVSDGQDNSAPALVTLIASTPNVPPNAHAGPDQTAIEGALVLLDGRISNDSDNEPQPLTFRWTFVSVPPGSTLQDSNIFTADRAQASFVPDAPGIYVLKLYVSDGQDSADDAMMVTVADDVSPNARAGHDQTVRLGDEVHLDASESDDPDNGPQPLVFQWRFVSVAQESHLTNAALRDAQTETPSFTPDVAGDYVLELAVFDGFERAFDNVIISATPPPLPPIPDLTVRAKLIKADLVWTPIPAAQSYTIFRSANGVPFALLKAGHVTNYAVYVDSGLTLGGRYCYLVRWVDQQGQESPNSNQACVTSEPRSR